MHLANLIQRSTRFVAWMSGTAKSLTWSKTVTSFFALNLTEKDAVDEQGVANGQWSADENPEWPQIGCQGTGSRCGRSAFLQRFLRQHHSGNIWITTHCSACMLPWDFSAFVPQSLAVTQFVWWISLGTGNGVA